MRNAIAECGALSGMSKITLDRVSRIFPGGHAAVRDVSLEIADGELLVLVGPSGSGKSTLLRLIAGLEPVTRGRIRIDDRDVTGVPPQVRDLAMVFQSYALYPHKTVRDNLAFGLRMRRVPTHAIVERVQRVADSLQIGELLDRRPAQLSGGQRQRVALGRAIVREPKAFLFDEPLSNLDPGLRLDTRTEIALLHRTLRATMIYVTHDQEEAMKLGERIVILRDGRIEQEGAPMQVYRHPATLFVGRFLGSPPMNVIAASRVEPGRSGVAGVRPQDVELTPDATGDLTGIVELVEAAGSEQHVHIRLDGDATRVIAVVPADAPIQPGLRTALAFRRDGVHFFPAADDHQGSGTDEVIDRRWST
jgi:ABC-type sugar transport system ATPase subunit